MSSSFEDLSGELNILSAGSNIEDLRDQSFLPEVPSLLLDRKSKAINFVPIQQTSKIAESPSFPLSVEASSSRSSMYHWLAMKFSWSSKHSRYERNERSKECKALLSDRLVYEPLNSHMIVWWILIYSASHISQSVEQCRKHIIIIISVFTNWNLSRYIIIMISGPGHREEPLLSVLNLNCSSRAISSTWTPSSPK